MNHQKKISVGILSLGCPKTLVDSEFILGGLEKRGFDVSQHVSCCDIALLNTCSFIEEAKSESVEKILELLELKKEGRIKGLVVVGCLSQRYWSELVHEMKEVDAFIGTGEYKKIPELVCALAERISNQAIVTGRPRGPEPLVSIGRAGYVQGAKENRVALTPRHFRYLKVSEGCNHRCSFCTIPSFRGKLRSRRVADLVREAEQLAAQGCKELVLTGQDTTGYGRDLAGKLLLPKLLGRLRKVQGIEWMRVLYAHPLYVTDELIDTVREIPKVCHYLDLPLQHINDRILKSMRRGLSKGKTLELIGKLRSRIPDLALRTSLIVGYPGETEAEFEELLEFMETVKFDRLGAFIYSKEEGTSAARSRNQLPFKVKEERFRRVMQLQQRISKTNNEKWVGKTLQVLIDETDEDDKGRYRGRSYMDAPEVDGSVFVRVPRGRALQPGNLILVAIRAACEYDLVGDLIE